MRSLGLLVAACAAILAGAAPPAAAAPLADPHTFRFEWLEGGRGGAAEGYLDVGRVAADRASMRERRVLVKRRVAVRIDGPGPAVGVSVALAAEAPGCVVRVDGVVVSTIPRLLDPVHRVGAAVVHQVEISIPTGMAPGPFLANLQWIAQPS